MTLRAWWWRILLIVLCVWAICAAEKREQSRRERLAVAVTGGDIARGRQVLHDYGCVTCHKISGVPGATGTVGPSLDGIAYRSYLAGRLANSPENLEKWVREPQHVDPGHAMPDMGLDEEDARDVAAFLYSRP